MQTFTAPITGNYKLEVWGAQGSRGGLGGYSIGNKVLSISTNLYICVGSQGNICSGRTGGNGGYNGGGNGGSGYDSVNSISGGDGGGGATHIAISSNRGVLKNYKDYYESELLLVAGGGGGYAAWTKKNGAGGGTNGGDAISRGDNIISGATQTSGYAFGLGQNGKTKTIYASRGAEGNGGGGGGFYGGLAYQGEGDSSDCGGAGGSGYVGVVINGLTIAGDQTFPCPSGGTETGHSGNGSCIITWQQLP